jgi:hypothetical protein
MKDFVEYFGISVCINDCDYKGLRAKESMLRINHHIANYCFYRFDDVKIHVKEDVIVASKFNDTTYKLFIKPNDIWEEVLCYIPDEFAELQKKIDDLLDIQYWNFNKYMYKSCKLYTGPGFMLRDGDEDVYFINYRKTGIYGLYEVSNWTNDEYSDDKTGFSHFEWVTKQAAESYINGESFVKELIRCSNRYSINFIKQILD